MLNTVHPTATLWIPRMATVQRPGTSYFGEGDAIAFWEAQPQTVPGAERLQALFCKVLQALLRARPHENPIE